MIQDALRRFAFVTCFFSSGMFACGNSAIGGDRTIRRKQPDRSSYQPPVIAKQQREPVTASSAIRSDADDDTGNLVDAPLDTLQAPEHGAATLETATALPAPVILSEDSTAKPPLQTVSYETSDDQRLQDAPQHHAVQTCSCESCRGGTIHAPLPPAMPYASDASSYGFARQVFDGGCDAAPGCDSQFCDGSSCDSIGCGPTGCGPLGRFGLASDDWFGSIELLLMFRKGDRLPALASDGALDDDTTQIFAGRETVFKDMTAGGRLTVGAWLDNYMDRNIVARGWFAGEQTYGFNANQNTHPTLVRPFFNVTDGVVPPVDDTRIIATPGEASGELSIHGDSNTFGADVSIRQLWYKRQGATVDLLYGYQYMGMDESLSISDRATALSDGVRPIGSVLATSDAFDVENDFHGGQIGVTTHYREGVWSFSSLAKIGFGSIRRRAVLTGSTFTSIDGNNATSPNGILVRSTNAGTHSDDTFGWVPELDFTIGWQKYPCFEVTFGYHLIAMTDALQLSGVIDPNLASNLADSPVGAQRPTANFRHGTFYVQGIHFGLAYVY